MSIFEHETLNEMSPQEVLTLQLVPVAITVASGIAAVAIGYVGAKIGEMRYKNTHPDPK